MSVDSAPEEGDRPGFDAFSLDERLLGALKSMGFENPTPIQAQTIPIMLEGRDIIGRARTGSGKTAAFGLPLLERLKGRDGGVGALVLTPTRELALQVTQAIEAMAAQTPVKILPIYGGTPYPPQLRALRDGVDVVVGTPGRILDHLSRGALDLGTVGTFVLDEADEMLRMGFIEDVETILGSTPEGRQIAFFSATMPDEIQRVARTWLNDPLIIQVEQQKLSTGHIDQEWMAVPSRFKTEALIRVLRGGEGGAALVFANTRRACAEVADALLKRGITADALHGDLDQSARERVLNKLRADRIKVVIATDVAARGIDVEHLPLVINYDLPMDHESYVHRIGRTGRAGRSGRALSFIEPSQVRRLRILERRLKVKIEYVEVPSDAHIAERLRKNLIETLDTALENSKASHAQDWITELVEAGDWTLENLAVAAITRLAAASGTQLERGQSDAPPPWSRDYPNKNATVTTLRDRASEVCLHLPVGRSAGVRPMDIVGALTNVYRVQGKEIGQINILQKRTFVRVSQKAADVIMTQPEKLRLRGKDSPITLGEGQEPPLRRAEPRPGHRPTPPSKKGTKPPKATKKPGKARINKKKAGVKRTPR